MTSSTACPSSFTEFYAEWYPRAVRAARGRGLRDPEAIAGDIMVVFLEKDYLDRYDGEMDGAVSFEGWVNRMIYNRLNNAYRDSTRKPQESRIEDFHEVYGDRLSNAPKVLEFKWLAMSAFELIRSRYGMELAEVWVSIVKQVAEDSTAVTGSARQWLISKHLKLSNEVVSDRMSRLREVIETDVELKELVGACQ